VFNKLNILIKYIILALWDLNWVDFCVGTNAMAAYDWFCHDFAQIF